MVVQWNSKNRIVGTVKLKQVADVRRSEYVDMLIGNVIATIASKCSRRRQREALYVQQDNARPGVKEDDPLVSEAGRQLCLELRVLCQLPDSPDLNVLDFGYFRSIQTLQHVMAPRSYDDSVEVVQNHL